MGKQTKYDLLIKGGHVVCPKNRFDGIMDVGIRSGQVVEVSCDLDPSVSSKTINCKGLLVMPGIVDSHAHLIRSKVCGTGFRMVVKAGVTTVIDFEGPVDAINREIAPHGYGLNVGVLEGIRPRYGFSGESAPHQEVVQKINNSMKMGALGVKLLGGHYPLSPETTGDVIETAAQELAYVAFHAGTTDTGSNILGLEEAVILSGGNPLHIAHINAYCRGQIDGPLRELARAMEILQKAEHIVSESHLAPFNGCNGYIGKDDVPESHVTRNCLRAMGYPVNRMGLKQAFKDGVAAVYAQVGDEMRLLYRQEAYDRWIKNETRVGVSFPVNLRVSALVCATEKVKGGNRFVVDAISSDGGAIPRNFILTHGMALVKFGALSLPELVLKACYSPAQMFGLTSKGHLSPGADADLALVDFNTGAALYTIISGKLVFAEGVLNNTPGCLLTTDRGAGYLKSQGIPYRIVDLKKSAFFRRAAHKKKLSNII
ncbi:MAG: amidohydrolase family protein [Bacillota bacterium]